MAEEKSEGLAAVLSFVIPGVGQMYADKTARGVGFLLGSILGFFLFIIPGVIIWIWSIVDAMKCAREYNALHSMRCPRCGATLPRGVMMCLICGAAFGPGAYAAPYGYAPQPTYYGPVQPTYYAPPQQAYYAPQQQQPYYAPQPPAQQPQYPQQQYSQQPQQQAYDPQASYAPRRPPTPP